MAYDQAVIGRIEDTFKKVDALSRTRANQRPDSPADRAYIKDLIQRGRVADLDIGAQILHLQEQQRRLRRYNAQTSSLLSPIRRLPDEILQSIFMWLRNVRREDFDEDGDAIIVDLGWYEPSTIRSIGIPGLQADAVCHHWRMISHSTPELWTSIEFASTVFGPRSGDENYLRHEISLVLERSKNWPLHIILQLSLDDQWNLVATPWDLIRASASRWESVDLRISLSGLSFPQEFIDIIEGDLPLLRQVSVSFDMHKEEDMVSLLNPLLSNSPLLSDFSIEYSLDSRLPAKVSIPPVRNLSVPTLEPKVLAVIRKCEELASPNLLCYGVVDADLQAVSDSCTARMITLFCQLFGGYHFKRGALTSATRSWWLR